MSTQMTRFGDPTFVDYREDTSGTTTVEPFVAIHQQLRERDRRQPRKRVELETSTLGNVASISYYITRKRVQELREDPEEGDVQPSAACFEAILSLIDQAAQRLAMAFPRGSASIGPGGSIRITWKAGEREIRLAMSDNPRTNYIYFDSGKQYGISRTLDGDALAAHLRWLSETS